MAAATNKKALDAPTGTTFLLDPGPDHVRIIGFDTKDGLEHPLADPERIEAEDALVEEKILSVMRFGVKKPILVRKDGNFVDVIDGRHRVRWVREANKRLAKAGKPPHRIECKIWRPTDPDRADEELMLLMVTLNESSTEDSTLTKAKKAQRMLSRGISIEEIAVAFNTSVKTIELWLKLLDVDTKVLKAVEENRIAPSFAIEISGVPRVEQVSLMEKMISEGRATVGEAKREVTIAKETRASAAAIPADNRRSKPGEKPKPVPAAPTNDHAAKPKMVTLNRLLQLQEIGTIEMHESFVDCMKWMLGLKSSSKIAGLNAMLKFAEKPVKKPGKK